MAQTTRTMSNTNRKSTNHTYNRRNTRNQGQTAYMYESAAPKLNVRRPVEEIPEFPVVVEEKKVKVQQMKLGYLVFLVMATMLCGLILTYYVHLQSELVTRRE